jgi:hypothetical protein
MELNTLIISVALIVPCVLLVVLIKKYNQKKKKEALASLFKLVAEKECTITMSDYWKDFYTNTKIAIDTDKLWLFFIRKINGVENKTALDLSGIKRANVISNTRIVDEGKNKQTVIDVIKLELLSKEKDKPDIFLEFYNNEYDSLIISEELQLAEKWVGIINQSVNK